MRRYSTREGDVYWYWRWYDKERSTDGARDVPGLACNTHGSLMSSAPNVGGAECCLCSYIVGRPHVRGAEPPKSHLGLDGVWRSRHVRFGVGVAAGMRVSEANAVLRYSIQAFSKNGRSGNKSILRGWGSWKSSKGAMDPGRIQWASHRTCTALWRRMFAGTEDAA